MLDHSSQANRSYFTKLSQWSAREDSPQLVRDEDWDWVLSAEQIARLSEEELTIWKDLLVCRESLKFAGIKIHPSNWKLPVVDLRQWEAHIPGDYGTPWSGGVYSFHVTFSPGSPDRIPKLRCFVPLFHPNVYPSGTWGYFMFPEISSGNRATMCQWLKSKQEDPIRFAKLLLSIRDLIHEPDLPNPLQADAYTMCKYVDLVSRLARN
ncbi:ubiquitin-conjugating enzyme/RWD-like protein [Mycena polygramma]|nr:ubiquitin-conjugating enzyme/RWD-like protein [Mycena polygramma]